MGIDVIPAPSAGKTRYVVELTSGSSWTVPAGVTYVNATLIGGGGAGGGAQGGTNSSQAGLGGQITETNVSTTPGASISYGIGAGGTGNSAANGGNGGDTTFTGATTASGGIGGWALTGGNVTGGAGRGGLVSPNYGNYAQSGGGNATGGAGGAGRIILEYFL